MNLIEFLKAVMPPGEHFFTQYRTSSNRLSTIQHHASIATIQPTTERDEWYSMAAYQHDVISVIKANVATAQSRCLQNIQTVKCLWLDIDLKGSKPHYDNKADALEALSRLNPNIIVDSGNGYHAYFLLPEPVGIADWNVLANGLHNSVMEYDPKLAVDVSQWRNASALLRLPGSYNFKTNPPNPVVAKLVSAVPMSDASIAQLKEMAKKTEAETTGTKIPASLARSGNDFKVSYATALTECNVLRQMAMYPDRVDEPSWYAAMGVLNATYEGEDAALAFSKGHPGFDKDATLAKYHQYAQAVKGITTCAKLTESAFEALCTGCPRRGIGKSPLALISIHDRGTSLLPAADALQEALNRLEARVQESVAFDALPEYTTPASQTPKAKAPHGAFEAFERLKVLLQGSRFTLNYITRLKQMAVSMLSGDKPIEIMVGGVLDIVEIYKAVTDKNGITSAGDNVLMTSHAYNSAQPNISTFKDLINPRTVQGELARYSVTVSSPAHAAAFMNQLISSAEVNGVKTRPKYATLGWTQDMKPNGNLPPFMCPANIVLDGGNVSPAIFSGVSAISHTNPSYDTSDPASVADALSKWVKANKAWPNLETGMIAFAASFASPFVSVLGIHSCTIHESGMAGCFKTTSLQAASSVWMHPEDALTNMQGINGLTGRAEQLVNIPIFVDEITTQRQEAMLKFVLEYANGTSKDRLSGGGDYGMVANKRWHNLCLTTGNISITEAVSQGGASAEGSKRRYMEFTCAPVPVADQETFRKGALLASVENNKHYWGIAGATFISDVQAHWDEFKDIYNKHVDIMKAVTPSLEDDMDAQQRLAALMLTCAGWVTRLGIMAFDRDCLYKMLLTSLTEQAVANHCGDEGGLQSMDLMVTAIIEAAEATNNRVAEIVYEGTPTGVKTSTGYCPEGIRLTRYVPDGGKKSVPIVIKVYDPVAPDKGDPKKTLAPVLREVLVLKSAAPAIAKGIGINVRKLVDIISPTIVDEEGNAKRDKTYEPFVRINTAHISAGVDEFVGNVPQSSIDNRDAAKNGKSYYRIIITQPKEETPNGI